MDDLNNYGEVISTPRTAASNALRRPKPRHIFWGVPCHSAPATPRKVSELIEQSDDLEPDSDVAAGTKKRPPQRKPSPVGLRNNCLMRKRRLSSTEDQRPHATTRPCCHLNLPARNSGDGATISFGLLSLIDLLKDGHALTCEGSAAGEDDDTAPMSATASIFRAIPGPKQWHSVPGADHNALDTEPVLTSVLAKVGDWFGLHLPSTDEG